MSKLCPRCNRVLEACEFYKNKARGDGLAGWCKECMKAVAKAGNAEGKWDASKAKWREENIEKVRESGRKSTHKWLTSEKGREYRRTYQRSEKYRAYVREYDSTPERREKKRLDNARPERVLQRQEYQSSEKYKQNRAAYRQSEAGKQAIASAAHRRNARKKGLVSDLTTVQWRMILKLYDGKCAYCGDKSDIQQEHVIPISRGGGTTIGNIVPACKKCNMSKKDKTVSEWFLQPTERVVWQSR